ncbi:MAG TPA: Wzz/FepE/Etk N-terminal domain-containing protein [Baekduia sp.]|nr:Wzz/FepE/Etk N-terminal domain-containing protein [Baekduia sp.]
MQDATQTVSLRRILSILARQRVLIAAVVVIAAGGALLLSSFQDAVYESESVVAFNDTSEDLAVLGTAVAPDFQPDKAAAAQAARVTHPEVLARVRRDPEVRAAVGAKAATMRLQDVVTTKVKVDSNLVSLTVEDPTDRGAAALANGFAQAVRDDATQRLRRRYRTTARTVQRRADALKGKKDEQSEGRRVLQDQASRLLALASFARPVDIVEQARVPSSPASPKPLRAVVLGAFLGLILGLGLAAMRHALDRRLRELDDVVDVMDKPIAGLLRTGNLGRVPLGHGGASTSDEESEPFRILRTNVGFLTSGEPVRSVLVTSPLPQEGKSTVAIGLAWAEAIAGRRTLLVDCDLRRPTVAERLGLEPSPGLAEYLRGEAEAADILQTVLVEDAAAASPVNGSGSSVVCIAAGNAARNSAELLDSPRFRDFLAQVSEVYDQVVLDSAPLLPVGDTLGLLSGVDGILLCLRMGQTTRDDALAARTTLEHFPERPTGVVLTDADLGQTPYYVGAYAYNRSPAVEAG